MGATAALSPFQSTQEQPRHNISLLELAIQIAVEAHAGQKDRNGQPCILHPLRVMARLQTEDEKIVAMLHDVLEDTAWTKDQLKKRGFPPRILRALDCVTKRECEAYEDFVTRSGSNPIALRVKLADLADNMDLRRLSKITLKGRQRLSKYLAAHRRLIAKLRY
jgi:(p)ppGpp synthase/HD superfamily hydrolase